MKSLIVKCGVIGLLLAGWVSCGQNKDNSEDPEEPYAVVNIENLQTRLRVVGQEMQVADPKEMWHNSENIIIDYLPYGQQKESACFGYVNADGETLLCEVKNFPESAKQWEGVPVHTATLGTVTEIDVKLNGTVRLYINDKGEKYGILELILLEPSEPDGGKPYARIENLQTRLRLLDSEGKYYWREHLWYSDLKDPITHKNMWRWDPKDIIIHFPPNPRYSIDTYFGYEDADGRIVLCEVINFPDLAKQWKADFSSDQGSLMEVNVQMSGEVRLYTDDKGEKYGTMELTSLKPSEAGEPMTLQLGVYTEIYPGLESTQINFIDRETLQFKLMNNETVYDTSKFKYEILDNYKLRLTRMEEGAKPFEIFFRVINDSKFERQDIYTVTAENLPLIMTFEKDISNNLKQTVK